MTIIQIEAGEDFAVYVVIPMWPEGVRVDVLLVISCSFEDRVADITWLDGTSRVVQQVTNLVTFVQLL